MTSSRVCRSEAPRDRAANPRRVATPDSQIRQLQDATGTALLRTGPGGIITLTADGEKFARDVQPVLEALAQSREKEASHAP